MTLSYGSVCSGIEAATVAWHGFGWRAAWFAEIESSPSRVLAHHYPRVMNLGDMTKIAALVRCRAVEAPDILVGGTPCQAFSVAGMREGLLDPRGQLTLSYCDLLDAIDEQRPGNEAIFNWENVPGVLSDKTNAFGCFLGLLAGEECALLPPGKKWPNAGYVSGPKRTIAWRVLDAQYFGVAQRRRRVFVVGSARNGFDPFKLLFESDGVRRDSPPSRKTGQNVAGSLTASAGRRCGVDDPERGGLLPVAGTLLANGKAAGSATQQDAENGLLVATVSDGGNNCAGPIDISTACNASSNGRLDFESETFLVTAFDTTQITSAAGAHPPVIAFDSRQDCVSSTAVFGALGSSSPQAQAVVYGCDGSIDGPVPPLMARSSRGGAQTLSPGHQTDGHMIGVCVTGDVTHCLKAEGFDASEDGTGRGQPIVTHAIQAGALRLNPDSGPDGVGVQAEVAYTLEARAEVQCAQLGMQVRRLIPRECERLQGFPDDYTLVPLPSKGKPKFSKDGPRYKALGNSMAVPCMRWLAERLILTHPLILAKIT